MPPRELGSAFSGSCEFVSKIDSAAAPPSTKIARAKIWMIRHSRRSAYSWKRKIVLKMLPGQVPRHREGPYGLGFLLACRKVTCKARPDLCTSDSRSPTDTKLIAERLYFLSSSSFVQLGGHCSGQRCHCRRP
jgi:hypothetical protein